MSTRIQEDKPAHNNLRLCSAAMSAAPEQVALAANSVEAQVAPSNLRQSPLSEDDDAQKVNPRDVDTIIAQISVQGSSLEQQCDAWYMLWKLSCCDEGRILIADKGGIPAIFGLLQNDMHAKYARVKEMACGALCNLAAYAANRRKIVEHGGVQALVEMIQGNKCSLKMKASACAALCNLTMDQAGQDAMIECSGVHVIVLAMDTHKNISELQDVMCHILGNLASCDARNEAINKCAGIKSIVSALILHVANIPVVISSILMLSAP
jgi:hypothetical protein